MLTNVFMDARINGLSKHSVKSLPRMVKAEFLRNGGKIIYPVLHPRTTTLGNTVMNE